MGRPHRKADIFKQTYRCCSHILQQTTKINKTNTYNQPRAVRVRVRRACARALCAVRARVFFVLGKKQLCLPRNLLQSQ